MRPLLIAVACCGLVHMFSLALSAQESAADLLPDTTVVYLEVAEPGQLLDEIVGHPFVAELKQSEIGERLLTDPKFVQFQVVLSFLELRIGMTWEEAVKGLTAQGVAVGVDPATEGVALVLRGESADKVQELRDVMIELVREEASRKGESDPYTTTEYRDVIVYQTKDGGFATHAEWLLVSNKGELGKFMIDQLLDGGDQSLSHNTEFQTARTARKNQDVWGFVNVAQLREQDAIQKKLFQPADNPLVELLVGGLQEVLRHCPYLTLNADLHEDHFDFAVSVPHDPQQIGESRDYWFGPDGLGAADALPELDGQILGLTTYRNASEMWLRAGDLFDERMNDKLAEADSTLTTLFAGKDFGTDVLGAFHPQTQIIVLRQTFEGEPLQPAIKLPAFGIVFRLRDPEKGVRELRRTFQSLIGFLNIVGSQTGQPQLELNVEKHDGVDVVSGSYIPEQGEEQSQAAPINFNFSPAAAFVGDRFVLASTAKLARSLVTTMSPEGAQDRPPVPNTSISLNAHPLGQTLQDNREQLIAQNMLEKGHTRQEAETEIDVLLAALKMIHGVDLELSTDTEQGTFDLHLNIH